MLVMRVRHNFLIDILAMYSSSIPLQMFLSISFDHHLIKPPVHSFAQWPEPLKFPELTLGHYSVPPLTHPLS